MNNFTFLSINTSLKRVLTGLFLVLSPWMILFVFNSFQGHYSVNDLFPCWNDEVLYWHEILSISSKGIDFGYYTFNELTPHFLSFGAHGFGSVSIYSLYALLFGWNYNSMVIVNNLLLSSSFIFLILFIKPNLSKLLQVVFLYFTFVPLILYSSTSMTELMNYAFVSIYFTLLYAYTKRYKTRLFWVLIIFVSFLSFIRIIYIVFFLPVFINKKGLKPDKTTLFIFVKWVLLSFILFYISSLFIAPYPESFLNALFSSNSIVGFVTVFIKHLFLNILRYIYPFRDDFLEVFQRYLFFTLTVFLGFKSKLFRKKDPVNRIYLYLFLIFALVILITISAYDVFLWRDYRVFAPILWGGILFLILSDSIRFVKVVFLINSMELFLLCLFPQLINHQFVEQDRYEAPQNISVLKQIQYTVHPQSKFENTIALESIDKDIILIVPAGIGVTISDTISDRLKSKYIFSNTPYSLKKYKIIGISNKGVLYQIKQ